MSKFKLGPTATKLSGKKVMINVDKIINSRESIGSAYATFIGENRDKEFTAITDNKTPSCYTFIEDDRFLFYEDDLIEV